MIYIKTGENLFFKLIKTFFLYFWVHYMSGKVRLQKHFYKEIYLKWKICPRKVDSLEFWVLQRIRVDLHISSGIDLTREIKGSRDVQNCVFVWL